jgi:hypothetical protein
LRRASGTFPFTSIGEDFLAADGFLAFIDKWHGFFSVKWPLMVQGHHHADEYNLPIKGGGLNGSLQHQLL